MRGNLKHHTSSFEILKHGNAQIELIEEDEYGDKQHMLERERYWVEKLDTVNKYMPMLTREEVRAKMREYHREKIPCSSF